MNIPNTLIQYDCEQDIVSALEGLSMIWTPPFFSYNRKGSFLVLFLLPNFKG